MLTAVLLLAGTAAQAQERGASQNDLTFAVTAGYDASVMQKAQPGNERNYSIVAPSTNWNDKSLRIGVELGWFFVDLWRVNVGGGFSFTNTPGYPSVPGFTVGDFWETGDIPDYDAVVNRNTMQFNVSLGFDRYFRTGVEGLLPYVGIKAGYAYGQDIAFKDDKTWMGQSAGEAFNICRSGLLLHGGLLHRGLGGPLRLHLLLHDGQAAGRPRCTGSRQPQLQRLRRSHHQDRFLFLTKQPQSDQ